MQSAEIGKLAEALARAQSEMSGAKKDLINPFFKSRYADLASVWEACRAPLSKNGLSIVQATDENQNGIILRTKLLHSSGQWVESVYPIRPSKTDPQGIGSAVTYARRYSLMALVGVSAEDDDGESAMDRHAKTNHQKPKPWSLSDMDLKHLKEIRIQAHWSADAFVAHLEEAFNKKTPYELTQDEYDEVCHHMKNNPHKANQSSETPH